MADFDSKSTTQVVNAITPAVLSADNTPAAIDLAGYGSALICTNVGVGGITFTGTNKLEFVVTHSEDNVTYTAVTADDVIMPYGEALATGGIIRAFTAAKAAADTECHSVGYVGKSRYIKVLADFSGTHASGTPIAAFVVKGVPQHAPPGQSNYES